MTYEIDSDQSNNVTFGRMRYQEKAEYYVHSRYNFKPLLKLRIQ